MNRENSVLCSPIREELEEIVAQGLWRSLREVEAVEGAKIRVDGKWLVTLASNSYLGLHLDSRVIAAAQEAAFTFGTGAGSSRLVGGTFSLHAQLEQELARFKQAEAAIVFPTGYMANLGIVTTLVGPGDLVLGDHLNHASLVDACRLSKATFRVYPHKEVDRLKEALRLRRRRYRRVLIVTEGLFSMEGDIAPLPDLVEVAREYDAFLLVDDAHATGVLGKTGRGTLEYFGISPEGILQMGTFSKALGSLGGFLAGPQEMVHLIQNRARSFIYTTALPPSCAAASLTALRILQQEPDLRVCLWENIQQWISGLKGLGWDLIAQESPIVSIRVGLNDEAMALSKALFELGVYAPGIRPPTVAAGTARIRTSITSFHTKEDLEQALRAFSEVIPHGVRT